MKLMTTASKQETLSCLEAELALPGAVVVAAPVLVGRLVIVCCGEVREGNGTVMFPEAELADWTTDEPGLVEVEDGFAEVPVPEALSPGKVSVGIASPLLAHCCWKALRVACAVE